MAILPTLPVHLPSLEELSAAVVPPQIIQPLMINLASGVVAAYTAYNNGSNNTPMLPNYTVVASIYVGEYDPNGTSTLTAAVTTTATRGNAAVAAVRQAPARVDGAYGDCSPTQPTGTPTQGPQLFGFAAYSNDKSHNIVVLRGTVTPEEAGYDIIGWDAPLPCWLPTNKQGTTFSGQKQYGQVNGALYYFYSAPDTSDSPNNPSLATSFKAAVAAVGKANPNKPWYVAAHSLGGPLATLGALDAYLSQSYGSSQAPALVTFGGLHLGDSDFATTLTAEFLPGLRFANECDFVPSMISLTPTTPTNPNNYEQVGLPITFVWQNWDAWANHSMQCIYQEVVTNHWSSLYWGEQQYPLPSV